MAVAEPAMWEAFIEHLEKMVAKRKRDLKPFEKGTMRIRRRGMGGQWVDITDAHARSIQNEITSLRRTIARVREEQGLGETAT